MFLRDLHIIDGRNAGGLMTDFDVFAVQVVELYLAHLVGERVNTGATAKINVQLQQVDSGTGPTEFPGNVRWIKWPFPYQRFDAASAEERKRLVLDHMHAALAWVAARRGWDVRAFDRAYQRALSAGLVYSGWLLKSPLKHPAIDVSANCWFEFGGQRIAVHAVLLDAAGNEIGRKFAYSIASHYDAVRKLLERAAWIPPMKLELVPHGLDPFVVDVSDLQP